MHKCIPQSAVPFSGQMWLAYFQKLACQHVESHSRTAAVVVIVAVDDAPLSGVVFLALPVFSLPFASFSSIIFLVSLLLLGSDRAVIDYLI